jgi:hypothetical protein
MISRVFANLKRRERIDSITLLFHQIRSWHHEHHFLRIRFDFLISFICKALRTNLREPGIVIRQSLDTAIISRSKHSEYKHNSNKSFTASSSHENDGSILAIWLVWLKPTLLNLAIYVQLIIS